MLETFLCPGSLPLLPPVLFFSMPQGTCALLSSRDAPFSNHSFYSLSNILRRQSRRLSPPGEPSFFTPSIFFPAPWSFSRGSRAFRHRYSVFESRGFQMLQRDRPPKNPANECRTPFPGRVFPRKRFQIPPFVT